MSKYQLSGINISNIITKSLRVSCFSDCNTTINVGNNARSPEIIFRRLLSISGLSFIRVIMNTENKITNTKILGTTNNGNGKVSGFVLTKNSGNNKNNDKNNMFFTIFDFIKLSITD